MPRKRQRAEEGAITADHHETPEGPVSTAVAEAPLANDVEQAFREHGITTGDQVPQPELSGNGQHHENGNGQEKHQPRPVREVFTSAEAGVHVVEDKRFALPRVGVDFDDDKRATPEEKDELKSKGFRYDPRDKGYTTLANPTTRTDAVEMGRKFTDRRLKEKSEQGLGQER